MGPSSTLSVQCPFRQAAMSTAKPPKLRPPLSPAKIQSDSAATPPPAIPAIEVGNPARLAGPLHGERRPQCTNGEDVACSGNAGCEGGEGRRTPAAEVVSRLAGSRLGAAEPRLSEEQLRINDQLQADEVAVVEITALGVDGFVSCSVVYLVVDDQIEDKVVIFRSWNGMLLVV